MKKLVRFEFDPMNPPSLTEAQKLELRELREKGDEDIDYSDIPPLTERFWQNAQRNPFYRPVKEQLTLRLDSDVVAWFKRNAEGGRGYQTNINQALRDYVAEQERKAG